MKINNLKTVNKTNLIFIVSHLLWAAVVSLSFFVNIKNHKESVMQLIETETKITIQKDLNFRQWNASFGGVYVFVNKNTLPNQYLDVPDRDIKLENGKMLTLINPAYMIRQVYELSEKNNGVTVHLTSLNPIRPGNSPDNWERYALSLFEQGLEEYGDFSEYNNEEVYRYIKAFKTEKSCLKCHSKQGYKEGDIRGGMGISVPMKKYNTLLNEQLYSLLVSHIMILLIGIIGLVIFRSILKKQYFVLESSEKNLKIFADNTYNWEYWVDLHNQIKYISASCYDISGYKTEEFYSKPELLNEIIHPEDRNNAYIHFSNILLENNINIETFRIITKSGETRWIKHICRPVYDETGTLAGRRISNVDITDIKIAEKKISESEEKMRSLIQSSPDGIIISDYDGKITFASINALKILKIDLNEAMGMNFGYFIDHNYKINYTNDMNLLYQGIFKGPKEYNIIDSENNIIPVEVNMELLKTTETPDCFFIIRDITDRKKTEEKLQILNTALNQSPVSIVITDKKGNIEYVNPRIIELTGYEEADLLNQNPRILQSGYTNPETYKELWNKISNGKEWRGELLNKKKDGELYWEEATIAPIRNKYNEITNYIAIKVNISKRKQYEKAMKESEARYRLLAENSHDVIWTLSPDGKFTYVSPSVYKLRGFTVEETMRQSLDEALCPSSAKFVKKALRNFFENMPDFENLGFNTFQLEQPTKNGSSVWTETTITYIIDDDKNFQGFLGVSRDITQRKKDEKILEDTKAMLEAAFEQNPTPMIMVTLPDKKLNIVNSIAKKILKIKENPIGTNAFDFKTSITVLDTFGNTVDFNELPLIKAIKGKKIVDEILCLKLNDVLHWFLTNASPIYNKYHEQIAAFMVFAEITDIKIAETKLKELNATKDKFFSIIAHDLRNPLGSLDNLVIMLNRDYDNTPENERKELLNIVGETASRVMALLENLLEWARSQRGTLPFEPIKFQLKFISKRVVEIISNFINAKNIAVVNEIPDALFAFADVNLTSTVIRNLISNAVKFTPSKGTITLLATADDNFITVTVSDTGIGMDDETISKLFRIDVQISRLGTAKEKGTGLGLILCKEFVEKQGGKIWAESNKDKGSAFKFTLPKASE